jgi:hypothetical protein
MLLKFLWRDLEPSSIFFYYIEFLTFGLLLPLFIYKRKLSTTTCQIWRSAYKEEKDPLKENLGSTCFKLFLGDVLYLFLYPLYKSKYFLLYTCV